MDTADVPPGGPRAAQSPALRGPRSFAILTALVLCVLLAALDQTLVAPALPTIVAELGALNHLPWVVTAYLLGATVTLPLYGRVGEAYGRRAALMLALLGTMAGATLCGAAPTQDKSDSFFTS